MEFIDAMAHLAQFKVGQIIKFTLNTKDSTPTTGIVVSRPCLVAYKELALDWEDIACNESVCIQGVKIGLFNRQNYQVITLPLDAKVEFASIEEIDLFSKKKEAYNLLTTL